MFIVIEKLSIVSGSMWNQELHAEHFKFLKAKSKKLSLIIQTYHLWVLADTKQL